MFIRIGGGLRKFFEFPEISTHPPPDDNKCQVPLKASERVVDIDTDFKEVMQKIRKTDRIGFELLLMDDVYRSIYIMKNISYLYLNCPDFGF